MMRRRWMWLVVGLVVVGMGVFLFRNQLLSQVGVAVPQGAPGLAEVDVPDGFAVSVFAEGLAGPRFMTVGPDGTLFVAERGANRVVALPDADADGVADSQQTVVENLDAPSSLAFRPGTNELYIGEVSRVSRVRVDGLTADEPEPVVTDLPERRGHTTTTVAFGADEWLYVSRGSTCNVCEEADPRLAAVWRYRPDGTGGELFMSGLRNAVGLALNPATGELWASNNGRDLLGNNRPPETLYLLQQGEDAGWPRCHAGQIADPEFGGDGACTGVAQPIVTMQAHSAPLGLTFYDGAAFPSEYHGDLFIAFHGSWNRVPPTGYRVVRVPMEDGRPAGDVVDFATGWLQADGNSPGRPVDVVVASDGALLVSDDKGGYIYHIAATLP